MTINFALSHQIISRTDSMILASGSKNYVTAQFDLLTEDWTAPITAIFNEYTVVLDENNQCLVPWEVLANPGKVAVSAFCGDLHTATSVLVPVHPGGYIDGQTPQPPTPDVYAQLASMVQTAVDAAQEEARKAGEAATDAETSKSKAEIAAETATGKAAEAASSAAAAKASQTNAAESQEAAASSASTASLKAGEAAAAAETATDQASDAAASAAAAKASETSAAGSADSAAQSAKKAEDAAKSVPLIDDTTISPDHPWSSQKIAETFCPPFKVSGPVVSCNPLVNSPLHVVSQIVPVQDGTGDPSPENVRPITGWTEANLWHGGKNLISGLKKGYYGTDFKLYEPNSTVYVSFSEQLPAGKYAISYSKNVSLIRYFTAKNNKTATTSILETDPINTKLAIINLKENDILYISFRLYSNDPWDATAQMEYGTQTSPYEPYKGQVVTLGFGQTVYGGTLDWTTGVLTENYKSLVFDGTEIWLSVQEGESWTHSVKFKYPPNIDNRDNSLCNIAPYGIRLDGFWIDSYGMYARFKNNMDKDAWKSYLSSQGNAGKPICIVYPIATPVNVDRTPQEIIALTGTNTLYTDTGDITVSGLADPIQVIQKLTERIAALEQNAIGG